MLPALRLILVSAIALFHEMLVIRWLAGECRVYGYYANLPLIVAVFGIGAGCLLARRTVRLMPLFAPLLLLFVLLATSSYFREISLTAWTGEQLRPEDLGGDTARTVGFYASFLFLLLLSGATFVPLGQELGRAFKPCRPLVGYSWNLVGSLLGIWGFVLASWVQTSSVPWFAVVALGGLLLDRGWTRAFTAACAFAALFVVWRADGAETWSPYYKIQVNPYLLRDDAGRERAVGTYLRVNHDYYQRMLDLRTPFASDYPVLRDARAYYDRPYRHVRPSNVLVVGAGTGNDVAAALRNGAERVDAVEIDPLILDLGRRLHPEAPYADKRVTVHIDDARSFLKETREKYDLIVFGLLDSHTLVSGLGRLRIDNYVYTIESLREARSHLTEGGVVYVAFTLYAEWIFGRFYGMFREVFGDDFVTGSEAYDSAGLYAGGRGVRDWVRQDPKVWKTIALDEEQIPELPTDDWPFLYKEDRTFPREYAAMLGLLLGVLALTGRGALAKGAGWDGQMAALGAAFLLIEVRGMAVLALLFGSTWIVNAIVITMILVMALLGNGLAAVWKAPPVRLLYVLLWGAVLLNFAIAPSAFLGWGKLERCLAGGALVALPLFFSGILFSVAFRDTRDAEGALGSNLLGAVAGGMSEYASMMTGIRALSLLALFYYFLGFLVHQRRGTT